MSVTPAAALDAFIRGLPKAELHLHIEGTLEPELVFALARRNGMPLAPASVAALRNAYRFSDLQSFLDVYYAGCAVLSKPEDFFDLTMAYLERAHADGVVHAEIFFDPQTHLAHGVPFSDVMAGITDALRQGEREWGLTTRLIMCFLRHLDEAGAHEVLALARPYREQIAAVGLDSAERDHPPAKFARVFAAARALGWPAVAHAGEEGPAAYIWEALRLLSVCRIDHGVACEDDPALMQHLRATRVPLTVCPLSNVSLGVVSDLRHHNLKRLLRYGLCVTVNSDDPAYFGGYIAENYRACAEALDLDREDLLQLARNSIDASFLAAPDKAAWHAQIARYADQPGPACPARRA